MNKIAQFHKVSFEQFKESWDDSFPGASEEEIKEIYDQITEHKNLYLFVCHKSFLVHFYLPPTISLLLF